MDLKKGQRTTLRQDHYNHNQAWGKKYHGVGLYGMEWSWDTYRDRRQDGCKAICRNPGGWSDGKCGETGHGQCQGNTNPKGQGHTNRASARRTLREIEIEIEIGI